MGDGPRWEWTGTPEASDSRRKPARRGRSPATGEWASTETTCTDALRGFRTQDDGRSSVTIYTYDRNDGHSFGAVDLHLTDLMGDTLHMTGTFNAVIGQ